MTQNDEEEDDDVTVRSQRYILAQRRCHCKWCRNETSVVALALPPGHESLTTDWNPCHDELVEYVWERATSTALLFYVESLPRSVHERLARVAPGYRFAFSESTQGSYFANHCGACGKMFDDHDLFCEPEGAFQPMDAADAAAIKLIAIDEPMEARAAGYEIAPPFLEFVSTG
jgi:hypothetical protein